jgi:hypothetical protein
MAKRTIKGERYNPEQLVDDAIAAVVAAGTDLGAAREALARLGHSNPDEALVARYAYEAAILSHIGDAVNEPDALRRQIGKWRMDSREAIVRNLHAYLDRRLAGQHARWTQSHR